MTISDIHTLAEELARKYNPDKVAPFPYINVIKDKSDLSIYYLDLDDESVSGATIYREEKFNILINTRKPENRQNFTLGHELGHYFLHQNILMKDKGIIDGDGFLDGSKILYRSDDERTAIEREANHFAACLLMPSELVRKAWQVNQNVEETAKIFKVSTVAMSIRLTELGLVT